MKYTKKAKSLHNKSTNLYKKNMATLPGNCGGDCKKYIKYVKEIRKKYTENAQEFA